ncbi:hypothetical protein QQ045_027940 [Rhodiola kirilowii]
MKSFIQKNEIYTDIFLVDKTIYLDKNKELVKGRLSAAANEFDQLLESNQDMAAIFVVKNQPAFSGASWKGAFSSLRWDSKTPAKPLSEYLCFPCPVLIPS